MSIEERKRLAEALEERLEDILDGMTDVLQQAGFHGIECVSFNVAPRAGRPRGAAPCPPKCVVKADGTVRCEPVC